MSDDPWVVAICYPREWWSEPGAFDAAVARLEATATPDGRPVEVVVAAYEESHDRRRERGIDALRDWPATQPEISDDAAAAFARMHTALALDLPADIATRAPNLAWVQAFGAGSDQFVSCHFGDHDVRLTSSAGSNAVGIAEFALGRLLEHRKLFPLIRELQQAENWQARFGSELAGTTLGLIGFGNICEAIAVRARAFDMRVVACRQSARPGDTHELLDGVYASSELNNMLGECDAVIAAVPDAPSTREMINADSLAAMKPGAFFCNVGRGSLVDEPALIASLEAGHLSGAALDVASGEPLEPGHQLWTAPNLSLSFHNAAVPAAMFANVHAIYAENLANFVNGTPLRNLVTP